MINPNLQLQLITRADVLDHLRALAFAHASTMRLVHPSGYSQGSPASREADAYSEGFYAALMGVCVGLNLSEPGLARLVRRD